MSTSIDGTQSTNEPQRLPQYNLIQCACCGHRVNFKFRSSVADKYDPNYRMVYLYCPICGHSATQRTEMEKRVSTAPRKVRYKYRP